MLEKFLVLLERFVVAHELIAANSGKPGVVIHNDAGSEVETNGAAIRKVIENSVKAEAAGKAPEVPVEGAEVIDTKPKPKKAPKAEAIPEDDDLADEPAPVKKTTPAAKDLKTMRAELRQIATKIVEEAPDEACDEFDELMVKYEIRTVPRLTDEQVPEFYAEAEDIVRRYFNVTD